MSISRRPDLPAHPSRLRMSHRRRMRMLAAPTAALVLAALAGGLAARAGAQTPVAGPDPSVTPQPVAPPQPTTGSATATSVSTATLSGTVLTGGADTTYRFEYGTSAAYGLATVAVQIPAAPATAPAAATLGGLTASTTYHYRLVATNAAGVVVGADRTFTTPAAPHKPAVAPRSATGIGATHATLVGRVNPYGQPTSYVFEWGTSSKVYGQVTPAGTIGAGPTQTVASVITGLQPNTRYVYRIVATNSSGTVRSSPRSVTTGRGLSTVSLTAARRTLDWEGVTVVSGAVRGSVPAGTKLRLMRQDFPFTRGWSAAGDQKASAAGTFAFSISRIWSATKFKVVADSSAGRAVESRAITVNTRVLARLSQSSPRRTSVRLRGVVYPTSADTTVRLERRTTSGRWILASRPSLRRSKGSERGTFSVRVSRSGARTLRYRMVVEPADGGAHVRTTTRSAYVAKRR